MSDQEQAAGDVGAVEATSVRWYVVARVIPMSSIEVETSHPLLAGLLRTATRRNVGAEGEPQPLGLLPVFDNVDDAVTWSDGGRYTIFTVQPVEVERRHAEGMADGT